MKLRVPRLRLLGRVEDLAIYLVDGQRVRDEIDVDFVNGGNGAVYPRYVPRNEIWIDDAQHPIDRTATALHELVERDLMLRHGMSYEPAHDAANARERVFRENLVQRPPTRFDVARVAAAYRAYLAERPSRKRSHQLDREIAQALSRTAVRRSVR
ncbi:MAG TPA: hypothetical protein VLE97_09930 [Gaiellaceae bacterium]|nr:hypothetical protein [Gaiellaceae bacterium]